LPIIRDRETVFRVMDAALAFFEKHGKPGERSRVVITRIGWNKFKKEMEAAYSG
jgi:dissimilatory sulfite reductase (desulfoviridin) alpha/beta subunit